MLFFHLNSYNLPQMCLFFSYADEITGGLWTQICSKVFCLPLTYMINKMQNLSNNIS